MRLSWGDVNRRLSWWVSELVGSSVICCSSQPGWWLTKATRTSTGWTVSPAAVLTDVQPWGGGLVSPVCFGNSLSENGDLNFLLSLECSVVVRKSLGASELPLLWILNLISDSWEKGQGAVFQFGRDCFMYRVCLGRGCWGFTGVFVCKQKFTNLHCILNC